ncbi:hypothetical protein [Pseudomonas anguilliseptica]|uniref:hypothetical protein n=1 Tax=Pseudomonas anguilliseptica TaxID=53406 RepID=UPI0022AE9EA1|nr:hypothetical protein [Pseudomonas anguilliseptica]MCZ4322769.1 hypothetical protein [Pseudomonas anguilliseptica]
MATGFNYSIAPGEGVGIQFDVLGLELQIAAGSGARHAQLAIGIDLNIAGTSGHISGQFYAHTGFGTDQANSPGVHAPQR